MIKPAQDDDIRGYLQYLLELINWLGKEGWGLLQKNILTEDEYNLLSEKAFCLWKQMSMKREICVLYMNVLRSGIVSLQHTIENDSGIAESKTLGYTERLARYRSRFLGIEYQLRPGERFGIGGRFCKIEESRALIESMIPLVQLLKDEVLLRGLAMDRYPTEHAIQEWFVKNHKNW